MCTISQEKNGAGARRSSRSNIFEPGHKAARLFKYYRQNFMPYLERKLSYDRISAIGFYREHQKSFDKIGKFFNDNRLDLDKYIKFAVMQMGCGEDHVENLCSAMYLQKYRDRLYTIEKYRRIYGDFMKSADKIAQMCVDNGFLNSKECLQYIINSKQLGNFVMGGVITLHYLAAIGGFDAVIPKLDHFTKDLLGELYDKFEIYSTEVNKAFLRLKSVKPNVLGLTDAVLSDKIKKLRLQAKNLEQ